MLDSIQKKVQKLTRGASCTNTIQCQTYLSNGITCYSGVCE
jgi:hypothetical protein